MSIVKLICRSQHIDVFRCVLGASEGGNSVSSLLPLNMQKCQREASIWRPTKCTEKVKTFMFLSYEGIVDDWPNAQKKCSFPLRGTELFDFIWCVWCVVKLFQASL